ncbi:MAG TPA: hypothetical protein VFD82_19390 [Planctomycetota bacterium]|nr:hypothetical protein [Planctomycetota bacterium]
MKNLVCNVATMFLLLAVPAAAQDQATALSTAARAAAVVVRATVVAATDPSPEWHRLQFRTVEVLKGTPGASFTLLEPSGACCGRSLFALQAGQTCLLFLRQHGALLHPFGGSRGVLPDAPEIVAHVRELLQTGSNAALARLLARNLVHAEPRIADDAAHALAVLPQLELAAQERRLLVDALDEALRRALARSAPLVEAAVRLQDAAMVDELVRAYLGADRADHMALLRKGLSRCSPAEVSNRLPIHVGADERRALRAAELLVDLPATDARQALLAMLRNQSSPRVQLCVAEGLLAAGLRSEQLTSVLPAPVLDLAQRRLDAPRTFRSITPHR